MMFSSAKQAEIIRSNQKDEYYVNYLKAAAADLAQSILGPRLWIKWRKEFDLLASIGYFGLTTLAGFQTLGEEYVNIVQVDQTLRAVPSVWRRGLMIGLHVIVPYLLDKLLHFLEKELRSNPRLHVTPDARSRLLETVAAVRHAVTIIHRCHLVVFYLRGIYYHIAKRFSAINYLLVRRGVDGNGHQGYNILGWLSLIQLTFTFLQQSYKLLRSRKGKPASHQTKQEAEVISQDSGGDSYVPAAMRCSLCLEVRKHSTATPCGHLYCWACITEWCSNKAECPLCREKFQPSRLVFLQNFDPT